MKFIIDENITPEVCELFADKGLEAWHVNSLKSHSKQRVRDDQLRHLSLFRHYIIVTKDDDFVKSFVSRKVPEKMIFIYGMNEKKKLLDRLKECLSEVSRLVVSHDFIEVNEKEIKLPFS